MAAAADGGQCGVLVLLYPKTISNKIIILSNLSVRDKGEGEEHSLTGMGNGDETDKQIFHLYCRSNTAA